MLKNYYLREGIDHKIVFSRISDIVIKTIASVSGHVNYQMKRYYKHCSISTSPCFELLSFDFLVEDTMRPWLLDVNTTPSLSCPNQ